MSREWKPGDVAKLTMPSGMEHIALRVCWPAADWISATEGGLYGATKIRPLVVIDPEDREQVDELCKALVVSMHKAGDVASAANGVHPATVTAALREFANPTPPKPAEPTGLGAVVEVHGRRWVYTGDRGTAGQWWYSAADPARWSDFDSVTVLSEGVTL